MKYFNFFDIFYVLIACFICIEINLKKKLYRRVYGTQKLTNTTCKLRAKFIKNKNSRTYETRQKPQLKHNLIYAKTKIYQHPQPPHPPETEQNPTPEKGYAPRGHASGARGAGGRARVQSAR